MSTLTQSQIDALRNKGLSDEKIQTIAMQRGYELPKDGLLKRVGKALVKSEVGFGQSMAGALGNVLPGSWTGKKAIDESNAMNNQITTNLIAKIKEKRAKGEDTTRLMNALKTVDKEVNFYDILNTSTGGSLDKTGKQVFGEGLGVLADVASFGTYGKAATAGVKYGGLLGKVPGLTKSVPTAVAGMTTAKTFGQGFKQGAKTGLIGGGAIGAGQGLTGGMQENLSTGQIAGRTVGGALGGAVTGGIIGGTIGGISGAIRGRAARIAGKEQAHALDLVSPKPTTKVRTGALEKGNVNEPGLFRPAKINPTNKDYQLADAVSDVVSPKKTVIGNIKAIDTKIGSISSNVEDYVAKNKVPFNSNQLKSKLNEGQSELKLIFASDSNAKKTYSAVVDEFMKHVSTKDTAGLLQGRKTVDQIPAIKKLLDSQGLGENTKKEIVLTVRRMANEYIADLLPAGNPYKADMSRLTRMIEAVENIAEKNEGMVGKNNLQIMAQRYPLLKWLIGGAATGIVGAAGVGVGSAIIGSTD